MSALTFTLKVTAVRIDCRTLSPSRLHGLSAKDIAKLPLSNKKTVADIFDVTGSDSSQIMFNNTSAQLDYIGYKMKDGQITIKGDAGDYLGAEMQGGTIICSGNVGERAADKMRRGILLIDGNAGAYCCSRMIAGTVGIYGNVGSHLGYALRRGTILLTKTSSLPATWLDCGIHSLPFLKLLFNAFKPLDSKFSSLDTTRVQRWMGEASQTGKGEILLFQD
ncbi:MAG: formylmethanofuran dehydrogenase subunit C [Methylophilaceae bacterium]